MDIQHTCTRKECYMKDRFYSVEGQGASTRISFVDSSAHMCVSCVLIQIWIGYYYHEFFRANFHWHAKVTKINQYKIS